jgi:hypothetical protein
LCKDCGIQFLSKPRKVNLQKVLWKKYVWHRQTISQLAKHYGKSKSWVRQQLDEAPVTPKKVKRCSTVIVADVTFVKRIFGVGVIRSPHLKKNLYWKKVATETSELYHELRWETEKMGIEITAAVIDGKPGIIEAFWDLPVQMCHFHQMQIMTRYLTTRPKTFAGQTLRHISLLIPRSNYEDMGMMLNSWHDEFGEFLKEKTYNHDTKRWHYTHKRLRSAHRSLARNLYILYTYQRYPRLNIPNTTNSLDGSFSHLKDMLRIHRGLKKDRKLKLINEILSK